MRQRVSEAALPIYLFLCLLLGGSSQAGGSLALQIGAIAIIAWVVVSTPKKVSSAGRGLVGLLIAVLALVAIQIVPLPPAWWQSLPGREHIEAGYVLLGMPLPPLPISFTPYATLGALLFLLPPAAIVVALLRLEGQRHSWMIAALFAGALLGILLGYLQVITGRFGEASWYIYKHTNVGAPVGFFANRNHMGTLLLMTLPFVVSYFFKGKELDVGRAISLKTLGSALLIFILLSLAVNGSLAAIVLSVPVVAASALLLPGAGRFRAGLGAAAGVALTVAIVFLTSSPVQTKLTGGNTVSFETRWEFWLRTWSAIESSWPTGTGLGSFDKVYLPFEPPYDVTTTFVNHAHNDYLEVLLETGLAGALLLTAFLVWWVRQLVGIFRSRDMDPVAGAAVIGSGAALAHSLVDYPLRTAAIAAAFAFCVSLMALRRGGSVSNMDAAPGARHLRIG